MQVLVKRLVSQHLKIKQLNRIHVQLSGWSKRALYFYQLIFTAKLNEFQRCIQNLSNIWDGAFCENSSRLSVVIYLRKKLHLRCLTWFWIRPWTCPFCKNYAIYFTNVEFVDQKKLRHTGENNAAKNTYKWSVNKI